LEFLDLLQLPKYLSPVNITGTMESKCNVVFGSTTAVRNTRANG
jgi:hypothetical protein